jgi:hypothetical protein
VIKIKQNIGTVDRIVRFIIGHALIIIGFFVLDAVDGATGGIVLAAIGALVIMTGAIGYCALYPLFKFSTKK